jgi:hypothetical protein
LTWSLADDFEKERLIKRPGESPLVELEAITTEISDFISEVESNVETFSESYGNNELLWSRLPHLVEILLKRT